MTSISLKSAWAETGEDMSLFPEEWPSGAALPTSARTLLREVGLPRDAAPFLSFGPECAGSFSHWELPEAVVPIGSNGSGDPVVVTKEGKIVYLNHDDAFAEVYVHRDIETLSEALFLYRELIAETQRRGGPDAYLDGKVPPELRANFVGFLAERDPGSLEGATLWTEEVRLWEAEQ